MRRGAGASGCPIDQASGEEAQALTRLNRGPRKNDSFNLLTLQRCNGGSHCQIRFPRAGRACSEYEVLLTHSRKVRSLVRAFGDYSGLGALQPVLRGAERIQVNSVIAFVNEIGWSLSWKREQLLPGFGSRVLPRLDVRAPGRGRRSL